MAKKKSKAISENQRPISAVSVPPPTDLIALKQRWQAAWPRALELWSKFTKLSDPRWCFSDEEAKKEGLTESFAMIRFDDQAVVINLAHIHKAQLDDFALEILAHEIGHHVYVPGDLTDHARMIARMRWGLPTKEHLAPFIANLYGDLLINDRLQRSNGLSESGVYETLGNDSPDKMWTFYMRMFEILWRLQKGSLAKGPIDAQLEGDALLGARLIRVYAKDWLDGAGKFAALCLPYLLQDNGQTMQDLMKGWRDTQNAGGGALPQGLTEMEAGEREGAIHPSQDPELSGLGNPDEGRAPQGKPQPGGRGGGEGQHRQPFEYGQILKALGLNLSDHEIAIRYYRERAVPHLIRFPSRIIPETEEPLAEGYEPWDIGQPLENADWLQSVLVSPRIIPGMTTVQTVWGTQQGSLPKKEPVDLDLYVDCSGSMPNPQVNVSYLTLAGAIMALSALRVGARVQVTLWSGAGQFDTTHGFVRDEHKILGILTGYFGGSTTFPIHILRDTYTPRKPTDRPVHILHISDDGITTMFEKDEKNNSGWDISRMALAKARGGGTMVLNLYNKWENNKDLVQAHADGWTINVVRSWEELVAFAREFSRIKYGET